MRLFALSRTDRRWVILIGTAAIALWGILVLWQPTQVAFFASERRIEPFLSGFYAPETATDGTDYRWTNGAGVVHDVVMPFSRRVLWTVTVATAPVPLGLRINDMTVLHSTRRAYHFLSDTTQWWGENTLTLRSTTFPDSNEARQLGVRMVSVVLRQPMSDWPALLTFLAGALLLFTLLWSARVLGSNGTYDGVVLLAGVGIVALLHLLDPRAAGLWLWNLALITVTIPPLILVLRRWFPLPLVVGWAGMLALRLWGIRYPGFEGHDYQIHLRRLGQFRTGIVSMIAHPYEYGRRQSIILPLYYRVADGLASVLSAPLAMHLLIVVAETSVALLVFVLLRRMEVARRPALFAALLVLLLPISSSVLYWSFMQQITAHVVTFAIAATAATSRRRDSWLAGALLAVVALTHIGETLIAALWYGCIRLAQRDRWSAAWWWRWVPAVLALLAVLPVYRTFLNGVGTDRGSLFNPVSPDVWAQMGVAIQIAVAPIPLLAAVIVVLLLLWRRPRIVVPWAATAVTFWVVELLTQAQVRYLYTGAPLVAVALGVALAPMWQRGRAARVLVIMVLAIVGWVSMALWVDAVMGWQKPRIDGLTH